MTEDIIGVNYDKLHNFNQYEVYETKFNIITNFQMTGYDNTKYKPEDKTILLNEKGEEEIKEIPPSSYIRWRYSKEKEEGVKNNSEGKLTEDLAIKNKGQLESNAKIVEWSNGSYQLVIGDEYYDIMFTNIDNVRLGVMDPNGVIVSNQIKQRILLTPSEQTEMKRTEKLNKTGENSSLVKLAYSFYDKQEYKKDDYNTKFSLKKKSNEKVSSKKRRRSSS